MEITPIIKPISFKYKSLLKTYWLKGKMPQVKYDMGGNLLTKKNCTIGHMQARSKGGKSSMCNYMLETRAYNMAKSDKPFSKFFDWDKFLRYCEQFKNIVLPGFNGDNYVSKITANAERLLRQGK